MEAGVVFETEEIVGGVEEGGAFGLDEFAVFVKVLEFESFGFGGGIAVLLEGEDGTAEAGERIGDADKLVGIDLAVGAVIEFGEIAEQFASGGGGELEAGLGEFEGVGTGEEVGEGFLAGAHFIAPEFVLEVILVTPVFPFGDVVSGQAGPGGAEVLYDFEVGDTIIEAGVDEVAGGFGKAGDFAGAATAGATGAGLGWGRGLRNGSGVVKIEDFGVGVHVWGMLDAGFPILDAGWGRCLISDQLFRAGLIFGANRC